MFNRRFLTVILAFTIILPLGALAQKRQVVLDRVVAIVGGSAILHSEVEEAAKELVAQRRAAGYTSDRDPMNEALEELMKQKLLYNQALIDSIELNGDVNSMVEDYLQRMIAEEGGSISQLEVKQHMPLYNYREILRQKLTEQQYAQSMQGTVVSDVTVTPGEVERFFKERKTDELPLIPEQYVYAHIVRYPASQAAAKQRTKERLLEMRERIITGSSSLPVLARTYSVDPNTAMQGGENPIMALNQLTPPFAEALAKLKPGQLSEVVETEYGFHIIELMEAPRNGLYRFRHILLRPTYTIEEQLEPTHYLDSLVQFIRSDSISFEQAALQHSEDNLSKMNGGLVSNHDLLMSNPQFSNVKLTATKFKKEDFGDGKSYNDYIALSKLKVGEVSDAFISEDVQGNQLSRIVKLLEIIPTHPASLTDDYLTIEEMALNDKQEKVFNKWLADKIDGIYVFIAPEFRKGEFEFKNWVK